VLQVKLATSGGDGAASEGGNPFGGDPSPTHPTVVVAQTMVMAQPVVLCPPVMSAASGGDLRWVATLGMATRLQ